MDPRPNLIGLSPALCAGDDLPPEAARSFIESGFVIVAGPVVGRKLAEVTGAYDEVMSQGSGPDFRIGSTTTRMSDLLNHNSAFDDVFLHPPLLAACSCVIGENFKLSSLLARTLRPGQPAQKLHQDLPRNSADAPMIGFILMIDAFRKENGATRFVSTSHRCPDLPSDGFSEVLGCGEGGDLIIFNGAIWHGHAANSTPHPRRSIQGYFVRRDACSGMNFKDCLSSTVKARMGPLASYLLALS